MTTKADFEIALKEFANTLTGHVSTDDGQEVSKGIHRRLRNVYTISSDTKIVSKILEIHLFPKILAFAHEHEFAIVLAEHQNYYPDISFVLKGDESVRFVVDLKTTYRLPGKPWLCNVSTRGSHRKYFQDRTSRKNIQFPYWSYSGQLCLSIIYDRADGATIDQEQSYPIEELHSITSVISNIQFSLQRNGESLVTKAALETQPTSEASSASRIFFRGMACSLIWVKSGLTITG